MATTRRAPGEKLGRTTRGGVRAAADHRRSSGGRRVASENQLTSEPRVRHGAKAPQRTSCKHAHRPHQFRMHVRHGRHRTGSPPSGGRRECDASHGKIAGCVETSRIAVVEIAVPSMLGDRRERRCDGNTRMRRRRCHRRVPDEERSPRCDRQRSHRQTQAPMMNGWKRGRPADAKTEETRTSQDQPDDDATNQQHVEVRLL